MDAEHDLISEVMENLIRQSKEIDEFLAKLNEPKPEAKGTYRTKIMRPQQQEDYEKDRRV